MMAALLRKRLPKHRTLVLKCYPRQDKRAATASIEPQSSELSYLLFYVSSRKTKLEKVGRFLREKAVQDVERSQIVRLRVTLEIAAALIDNVPQDVHLLAWDVLEIIRLVPSCGDLPLVQSAIAVLRRLCLLVKPWVFFSDPFIWDKYLEVVQVYASLESLATPNTTTTPAATPVPDLDDGVFPSGSPQSRSRSNSRNSNVNLWQAASLEAVHCFSQLDIHPTLSQHYRALFLPTILHGLWVTSEADAEFMSSSKPIHEILSNGNGVSLDKDVPQKQEHTPAASDLGLNELAIRSLQHVVTRLDELEIYGMVEQLTLFIDQQLHISTINSASNISSSSLDEREDDTLGLNHRIRNGPTAESIAWTFMVILSHIPHPQHLFLAKAVDRALRSAASRQQDGLARDTIAKAAILFTGLEKSRRKQDRSRPAWIKRHSSLMQATDASLNEHIIRRFPAPPSTSSWKTGNGSGSGSNAMSSPNSSPTSPQWKTSMSSLSISSGPQQQGKQHAWCSDDSPPPSSKISSLMLSVSSEKLAEEREAASVKVLSMHQLKKALRHDYQPQPMTAFVPIAMAY